MSNIRDLSKEEEYILWLKPGKLYRFTDGGECGYHFHLYSDCDFQTTEVINRLSVGSMVLVLDIKMLSNSYAIRVIPGEQSGYIFVWNTVNRILDVRQKFQEIGEGSE